LIRAAARVPECRLVIVGDGEQRPALEGLVGDHVELLGWRNDIARLMAAADSLVVPSLGEGFSLVILEALASGCFPLGTYFAGMAASIDAVSGAMPAGDAALMKLPVDPARKVAEIAQKAADVLALGSRHKQALRDAVAESHDWATVARRLAKALSDLNG